MGAFWKELGVKSTMQAIETCKCPWWSPEKRSKAIACKKSPQAPPTQQHAKIADVKLNHVNGMT
eukprot:scaffold110950_cov29-Tisochrysis_lutea.AAC.2